MITFDFSELNNLAVDIAGADARVRRNVKAAVKTAAFKGKKAWVGSARGQSGRRLHGYPSSIDYDDVKVGSGEISTEIGPSLGGQGSLGTVEEAPGGWRGKPQRNREKIMPAIQEDLTRGILIAAADGVEGG